MIVLLPSTWNPAELARLVKATETQVQKAGDFYIPALGACAQAQTLAVAGPGGLSSDVLEAFKLTPFRGSYCLFDLSGQIFQPVFQFLAATLRHLDARIRLMLKQAEFVGVRHVEATARSSTLVLNAGDEDAHSARG